MKHRGWIAPPSLVLWIATLVPTVAGCQGEVLLGAGPSGSRPEEGSRTVGPLADSLRCARSAETASAFLELYCASCHTGRASQGGFDYLLDATRLRESGKVIPGDADASPLYARPLGAEMPPSSAARFPETGEVETLRDWIECGAPDFVARTPREYVSVADVIEAIADDVEQAVSDTSRQDYRYILLTNLHNAGFNDAQIEAYRGALSHLVNSLSQSETIVRPVAIDVGQTVYRIRLSDYGWDAALWDRIVQEYPYDIRYQSSFGFREDLADDVRSETGTPMPFIFGDWFIEHASVPPLYYEVLRVPGSLSGLEAELELNITDNLRSGIVRRAGTNSSGVSNNNRVIERHDIALRENRLGERLGSLWVAYDFQESTGTSNIFSNPLDFQQSGSEAIFDLPNGLHGYVVVDAEGNRLDKAPQEIVFDPEARDGAVQPGASCMSCHDGQGIIPTRDEVRPYAELNLDVTDRNEVVRLYAEADEMNRLMIEDGTRFIEARALAMDVPPGDQPVLFARELYDTPLVRSDAAATLGLSVEELDAALNDEGLPAAILALRNGLGTIKRDVFEAIFAEVATEIGLALSADPAPPDASPPEPVPPPAPVPPPNPEPPRPAEECADQDLGSSSEIMAQATTTTATDDFEGSCGGLDGRDIRFSWTAPRDGTYLVSTAQSSFDTVLYVRSAICDGGVELTCDDNGSRSGGGASALTFSATAGEPVFIIVDGYSGSDHGDIVLNVREL